VRQESLGSQLIHTLLWLGDNELHSIAIYVLLFSVA